MRRMAPLHLAIGLICASQLAAPAGSGSPPLVSAAGAPAGAEMLPVQWVKIAAPGIGVMLAAVARPAGSGPFPAVVLLHGSHGFAPQYVQLAEELARNGLIAVAPCWFSGGSGAGSRFVAAPIRCPEAPPMPMASSPEALRTVDALVQAVAALPGVRGDRVGLFGHSRGAGAALHYALGSSRPGAVVLDSSGYPDPDVASRINAPVLILHGSADGPSNAGTSFTAVQRARDFEKALRRAGKPVEARYYDGGEHNGIFTNPTQHDDEVKRIAAFLRRNLAR